MDQQPDHSSHADDIGHSLGTDYFLIRDQLTPAELEFWRRTRRFASSTRKRCPSRRVTGTGPSSRSS
jgi:hypothetical protein